MRGKAYLISDEQLIDVYLNTKSLRQTAMISGMQSMNTLARKLRSLGIEVKNHKLKPIQISDEEIVRLYNSGLTLQEIARRVSGSKGAMQVRKILQNQGIDTSYKSNIDKYKEKMSKAFRKYTLNEHVFDCINSEEKAYWLGFLMADGYNNTKRTVISLRLQAEDREILEKFKDFLESNTPIYTFERITKTNHLRRQYNEVSVNSVYLSKQLAQLGCTKGKTYTLEYPTCVPSELMHHFIRGYFDGDGCICVTKRRDRKNVNSLSVQLTITGRKEFLQKIQEWIVKGAGVTKTKLEKFSNNFAQTIHYGGRIAVTKILEYLYKDATLYLKRKHDKYLNLVSRQSNLQ